jgi:hypothetical protein
VLKHKVAWLLAPLNFVVLKQDLRIFMTQEPGNLLAAPDENTTVRLSPDFVGALG